MNDFIRKLFFINKIIKNGEKIKIVHNTWYYETFIDYITSYQKMFILVNFLLFLIYLFDDGYQ